MKIKLNLVLSVILEAVKAETHIKASIDRASGDNANGNAVAYHEDAGDEKVHERKLMRGIYTSVDKLRSYITDYLNDLDSSSSDNNVASTISDTNDAVTITIDVSDRYNKANSDSLARACSKYIEDNTLVLWWGAINQNQMQFYQALLTEDIATIQRLFTKRAPKVPVPTYTTTISLNKSSVSIDLGESETVTYTIAGTAIDDIDAKVMNWNVAEVERTGDRTFKITGICAGSTRAYFTSKHNSSVSAYVDIDVEEG